MSRRTLAAAGFNDVAVIPRTPWTTSAQSSRNTPDAHTDKCGSSGRCLANNCARCRADTTSSSTAHQRNRAGVSHEAEPASPPKIVGGSADQCCQLSTALMHWRHKLRE